MPRPSTADRVKSWQSRVNSGSRCHKKWAEKYQVDDLESLYDGTGHWEEDGQEHYTINLCYPTVETKLPSLLFYRPKIRVESKPARSDDPATGIDERSRLREDTINTFIADKRVGFKHSTTLALKEAFYSFGMVEVGYTNDFIDNPNAKKPILKDGFDLKNYADGNYPKEAVAAYHPDQIPGEGDGPHEFLYVRRIPACQWVFPSNAKNRLQDNDWYGYYEDVYLEDVKKNPAYSNTDSLRATGKVRSEYGGEDQKDHEGNFKAGTVRIWKVWDLRAKVKRVWADGNTKFLQEKSFSYAPHSMLKFHDLLDDIYPVPPLYNWISPQKELNEIRDMQRIHRKRFYRRYLVSPQLTDNELKKLEDGGDGVYARVEGNSVEGIIAPVPDAPLDRAITVSQPKQVTEDMFYVTGQGGEAKGVAESETATQAGIIETNARVRETKDRQIVADWLGEIAFLMLQCVQENMALPFWVRVNVDPLGQGAEMETLRIAYTWKEISAEDLGDLNYEVSVDVESLSPVTEDLQRTQWMNVLGLIQSPATAGLLMSSDAIMRKTLGFFGIRSEREVQEVRKAMGITLQVIAALQAPKGSAPGGAAPGGAPAPGPTPGPMEMQAQMGQQMGM